MSDSKNPAPLPVDAAEIDPAPGQTPLARVRGHGSAQHGAEHWWTERLTAIATFLLFVWFLVSLLRLPTLDHKTVTLWLAEPVAAVPMLLLIVATFWHLKLGLQVVIEDYVHDEGSKLFSLLLVNFFTIAAGAYALFAVLQIALGADPAPVPPPGAGGPNG